MDPGPSVRPADTQIPNSMPSSKMVVVPHGPVEATRPTTMAVLPATKPQRQQCRTYRALPDDDHAIQELVGISATAPAPRSEAGRRTSE